MAVQWLNTEDDVTQTKGGGSSVSTTDSTTRTTEHGEKTTTRTSAAAIKASTQSVTLTEDAGGMVSFSVPVRGGLGLTAGSLICPISP